MIDFDKIIENIEDGLLMARGADVNLVHMSVDYVEEVLELLKSQHEEIENLRTCMQSMMEGYCVMYGSKACRNGVE